MSAASLRAVPIEGEEAAEFARQASTVAGQLRLLFGGRAGGFLPETALTQADVARIHRASDGSAVALRR